MNEGKNVGPTGCKRSSTSSSVPEMIAPPPWAQPPYYK